MTEPTKQARQRCADLSNEESPEPIWHSNDFLSGDMPIAFARLVQQTSDTMREIVRLLSSLPVAVQYSSHCGGVQQAIELARPFILPEPEVDPLLEALNSTQRIVHWEQRDVDRIREYLAKSGKKIMIVEAE